MKWMHPNTITGSQAEGPKYFKRVIVEERLWREIKKSNHILFLAPRRVGKSSIVINMAKNPYAHYACIYENIQSDSSVSDFYRRMISLVIKSLHGKAQAKAVVKKWKEGWKIRSITTSGIEIDDKLPDYKKIFFSMLEDLQRLPHKVVLFLDEFPDVLKKIAEQQSADEAENLLDDLRALRHNSHFKKVFILVLLGSVGLQHIVKKITQRSDKINDLHTEHLRALDDSEAEEFIDHLVHDASMQVSKELRSYVFSIVGHFPFFIQLLIEECDDLLYAERRPRLTKEDVDMAFERILRKNDKFSDWDSRLSIYFPEKASFLKKLLSKCAHQGSVDIQEVYNLARQENQLDSYKIDLDDILIADGYLVENDGQYSFHSPLLKAWWTRRHPIL